MTDVQAPMGAELATPSNNSPDTNSQVPNTNSDSQAPTAIELKEDSLVRIPGVDKPVKWTDHVRGFQSQATKASQRAAQLERTLQEREAAIQRYEQQQRQIQQQTQGSQGDPLAELASAPYVTGAQTAEIVRGLVGELQQRDQFLMGLMQAVKKIQGVVGGLNETHTMSSFDSKINNWLKEGGYSEDYADLAKEIYLAYTGDDLDSEFPQIFKARVEQIEGAIERKRRAAVEAARRAPFVPGKGGEARPSKPLTLNPRNTARQDAEELWEQINGGGQGT